MVTRTLWCGNGVVVVWRRSPRLCVPCLPYDWWRLAYLDRILVYVRRQFVAVSTSYGVLTGHLPKGESMDQETKDRFDKMQYQLDEQARVIKNPIPIYEWKAPLESLVKRVKALEDKMAGK